MQACEKRESRCYVSCTASEVGVCPGNYAKQIRYLDVSRQGPDRLFLSLTNVHYSPRSRRPLLLVRSRLTCSGAVRARRTLPLVAVLAAEGAWRLSEAQRAPAGLLIAITINNLAKQEGNGCIGESLR